MVRKRAFLQRLLQNGRNGQVGMDRFRSAAQNDRVAGFEAQSGGVHRDIRARFVNDADDAQGNPHPPHQQTIGASPHGRHFPDGVGQSRDFPKPPGHGCQSGVFHGQTVDHGGRKSLFPRGGHIPLIRGQNPVPVAKKFFGHARQDFIFLAGWAAGKKARGRERISGYFFYTVSNIHGVPRFEFR